MNTTFGHVDHRVAKNPFSPAASAATAVERLFAGIQELAPDIIARAAEIETARRIPRVSLEYCCITRNLTDDDATMRERFTVPRSALELDNTISSDVTGES